MRALIYGHSQSGGMGLDLEKALKKAGAAVTRVTKVGWSDKKLVQNLPSVPTGPYDRVFLYVGANTDSPSPTEITQLVQAFGADRTVAILPPLNTGRTKKGGADATAALAAKNAGNRNALAGVVKVYEFSGALSDFEPDQIHMKPGSAASKAAAQVLLADALGGLPAGGQPAAPEASDTSAVWGGLGVVALLGLVFWLRLR